VHYATALAESLPLRTACASLIVAAQAAHWFDFDRYYAECRRALKPGGVVAAWTYQTFRIDPRIDASIGEFYSGEVGPYWPPERVYVEQGYRTLPFPLAEEAAPRFELETDWTLEQVMGYLATWSSVQRYKDARGTRSPAAGRGAAAQVVARRRTAARSVADLSANRARVTTA
jgi:SAM-dependent methyltransferase